MLLLAQVQTGTLVLLAAVGLTVAVLLVRSQRGLRRQPSQASTASQTQRHIVPYTQRPATLPAQRRTPPPEELNRWEGAMQELARDLKAELDGKIGVLQHLIRSGEALANRLEALLERAERAAATSPQRQIADNPRVTPARSLVHPDTQAAALASVARGTSTPTTAAVAAPASTATPAEPLRRFDEIYALADAGRDSATIAGTTGSPIGEVELILSLRERAA